MAVLEIAKMRSLPGQATALEVGLSAGAGVISSSPGCLGVRVCREIEDPDVFVLLVQWESLELHQEYLSSSSSPRFRAHIEGHRDPNTVEARHYRVVVDTGQTEGGADVLAPLSMLVDKQEISELVTRYCHALDTRDWEMLATCFVPNAVFEGEGLPTGEGFAQIREIIAAALSGLDQSQHYVSNLNIHLHNDRASLVCYLQAQHVRSSAGLDPNFLVAGIYRDEVVRTNGGWRFARRNLAVTWTSGNPAVPIGAVASKE